MRYTFAVFAIDDGYFDGPSPILWQRVDTLTTDFLAFKAASNPTWKKYIHPTDLVGTRNYIELWGSSDALKDYSIRGWCAERLPFIATEIEQFLGTKEQPNQSALDINERPTHIIFQQPCDAGKAWEGGLSGTPTSNSWQN